MHRFIFLAGFLAFEANATSSWNFKTPFDKFSIQESSNGYQLGSKSIDFSVFDDYSHLFNIGYGEICPTELSTQKPDVIITKTDNTGATTREFFLDKNYVKHEDKCLFISGQGLRSLPLHRNWFIGPDKYVMTFGKKIQFKQSDQVIYEFVNTNDGWQNNLPNKFMNMEHFTKFLEMTKNISIDGRINSLGLDARENFEIHSGKNIYRFYYLAPQTWALETEKSKWLVKSQAFAFFGDFEAADWLDRYSSTLNVIINKGLDKDQRVQAIDSLKLAWSDAIKQAFHHVLLDPSDTVRVKKEVLAKMKRKPTLENMRVMVKSMDYTRDPSLLEDMTKILRIRHRNGPLINEENMVEVENNILKWKKWAEQIK